MKKDYLETPLTSRKEILSYREYAENQKNSLMTSRV